MSCSYQNIENNLHIKKPSCTYRPKCTLMNQILHYWTKLDFNELNPQLPGINKPNCTYKPNHHKNALCSCDLQFKTVKLYVCDLDLFKILEATTLNYKPDRTLKLHFCLVRHAVHIKLCACLGSNATGISKRHMG